MNKVILIILFFIVIICGTPNGYGNYFVKVDSINFQYEPNKVIYISLCRSSFLDKEYRKQRKVIGKNNINSLGITSINYNCSDSFNCESPNISSTNCNKWFKNNELFDITINENKIACVNNLTYIIKDKNKLTLKYTSNLPSRIIKRLAINIHYTEWEAFSDDVLLPSNNLKWDRQRIACDSEIDRMFRSIDSCKNLIYGLKHRALFQKSNFYEKTFCDKYKSMYLAKTDSITQLLDIMNTKLDKLQNYIEGY